MWLECNVNLKKITRRSHLLSTRVVTWSNRVPSNGETLRLNNKVNFFKQVFFLVQENFNSLQICITCHFTSLCRTATESTPPFLSKPTIRSDKTQNHLFTTFLVRTDRSGDRETLPQPEPDLFAGSAPERNGDDGSSLRTEERREEAATKKRQLRLNCALSG